MPRLKETYSYVDEWKNMWEPDLEAIAYNGATCDPTRVDPKVLQWAKHNCSHKPHFIKIVNNNAANGRPGLKARANNCQLTVPRPFVKEHFRELERVVTLENDEGKTWRVSFGAARTDPSWLQGWKRVATDNDLKPGEVMAFVLVANSRFHFTRFDENGNILSKKSTNSTQSGIAAVKKKPITTTHSASQSHEKPGSVTNSEVESHRRTSWKSKRALALASRDGHCTESECGAQPSGLGFDGHGHEAPSQLLAPAHKQIAEAPCKRRRLRKVGEIKSKANSNNELNLAMNNIEDPLYDSEEAGSTSIAGSPSTITIVTSHTPQDQKHISYNS